MAKKCDYFPLSCYLRVFSSCHYFTASPDELKLCQFMTGLREETCFRHRQFLEIECGKLLPPLGGLSQCVIHACLNWRLARLVAQYPAKNNDELGEIFFLSCSDWLHQLEIGYGVTKKVWRLSWKKRIWLRANLFLRDLLKIKDNEKSIVCPDFIWARILAKQIK